MQIHRVPEAGVEQTEFPQCFKALPEKPGAQAGAIGFDSDLQGLIDAWPGLNQTTRAEIMKLIERD